MRGECTRIEIYWERGKQCHKTRYLRLPFAIRRQLDTWPTASKYRHWFGVTNHLSYTHHSSESQIYLSASEFSNFTHYPSPFLQPLPYQTQPLCRVSPLPLPYQPHLCAEFLQPVPYHPASPARFTCMEFRMANRYSVINRVPEKFRRPTTHVTPSRGHSRAAALAPFLRDRDTNDVWVH